MSIIKNIKEKDERLDKIIKQILNIKDDNISFSKDAVSKKKIHGRMANVFTGVLTYKIDCCPLCGFKNIIRHAYKDSWIQLIPYQEVPTYLHLFKQRFLCKDCRHTFSANTYYVAENCYIAQPLKFAIAVDLKRKSP